MKTRSRVTAVEFFLSALIFFYSDCVVAYLISNLPLLALNVACVAASNFPLVGLTSYDFLDFQVLNFFTLTV